MAGDLAVFLVALFLALKIRYGLGGVAYDYTEHVQILLEVFLLWLIIFYINQLYDITKFDDKLFLLYATSRAMIANFVVTITFFYIIPKLIFTPKTILFLMIFLTWIGAIGWRLFFTKIFAQESWLQKIIIIGNEKLEINLAKAIKKNPYYGMQLLGIVATNNQNRLKDIKNLGTLPDLEKILSKTKAGAIALDINSFRYNDKILQIVADKCISRNINVIDIYYLYEKLTGKIPLENIGEVWFTNFNQPAYRSSIAIKRIVDIGFGLAGLLIFVILTPLLYLLVKIDSSGPYLYRQSRMGAMGKIFNIYKIRTMQDGSEGKKAVWAKPGDKRVTRIGRVLRKTCLDELPQFWNILNGEMSFVGPRPERPEFIAKLTTRQKLYYKRHLVKPGLTGWAQVMANYGASFSDADEKLQYDLYYVKNRSIFLDLIIILRTIRMLFVNRGGV